MGTTDAYHARRPARAVSVTPVATIAIATRPATSTAQRPANVLASVASALVGSTSCWARPTL